MPAEARHGQALYCTSTSTSRLWLLSQMPRSVTLAPEAAGSSHHGPWLNSAGGILMGLALGAVLVAYAALVGFHIGDIGASRKAARRISRRKAARNDNRGGKAAAHRHFEGVQRPLCHFEGVQRPHCHFEGAQRPLCHFEGALATEKPSGGAQDFSPQSGSK